VARWNAAEHPRYPNGRFRPKLSQSVRLSTRSISYNAGVRVPVLPGRAQLYVGALVRVERVNGSDIGRSVINRGIDNIAGRFGDKGGQSNIAKIFKGEDIQVNQFRIQAGGVNFKPNFRVSTTPATRRDAEIQTRPAANGRSPRRRARTRSSAKGVPSTLTAGDAIQVAAPRPRKPRKTTRKSNRQVTSGTRVKR